ncbi:ABC transporter permease subunit [Halocatena marina]|uniref:ABC transporter permease subunit n=1 Tax=Halocatena marina TaxID=2934937 RepID=UPI00200BE30E|nr:ABC transporter permease subunit [Halocatena marina]
MIPKWIVKRILQAVLTIFIVVNLAFVLVQKLPGGPLTYLRAQLRGRPNMAQQIELMKKYLNINPQLPLHERYINYMSSLVQGDLGFSLSTGSPVSEIIAEALPWTIFIMSISISLAFIVGISLGAIMAYKEGTRFDSSLSLGAIFTQSVPYYIFALVFVFYLGYYWGIFPTGGRYGEALEPGWTVAFLVSVLYHALLPILSIILTWAGGYALGMRGNSIQILGKDYLHVGRLRGLSSRRIALRYVGRNAILPMYTHLVLSIGAVFGGSVILEEIFRYQGIGFYLFKGIEARDYPLMMGTFMVIAIAVIVGIFIADLTYGLIDPRTGSEGERETYSNVVSAGELITKIRARLSTLPSQATGKDNSESAGSEKEFILDTEQYLQETPNKTERYRRFVTESVIVPAKVLLADWRGRVGLTILLAILYLGTIGVMVVPEPSTAPVDDRFLKPFTNWAFPLGTDRTGKGLFSQTVHATPYILKMIASGAVFATAIGVLVGLVSGYIGGIVDRLLMTLSDTLLTLPGLPLVIVITFFLDTTNPYFIGLILAINNWTGLARALRSQVLTLRDAAYVESARTMGLSTSSIVRVDLLPNLMPYISVSFVSATRRIIFEAVALYYLGVLGGITPNWGVMMSNAVSGTAALYNSELAHIVLVPMFAVVLLSLGSLLLAQSADRVFNPRLRTKFFSESGSTTVEESESSGKIVGTSD